MAGEDFNVTDPIFEWARRAPDGVALIHGASALGYAALCAAIAHAAGHFQRSGVSAGDVVGICLPDDEPRYLVAGLGLARMGATQVSLPPGDPVPLRRARVQGLGIKTVVGDDAGLGDLVRAVPVPGLGGAPEAVPAANGTRAAGGSRNWIIAQSSGTTAAPKHIAVSHRAEFVRGRRLKPMFAMRQGERYLNLTSLRFQVGMAWAIRCLSDGAAFLMPPSRWKVNDVAQAIEGHEVGFLACTPQHLHAFLQEFHGDAPKFPGLRVLRCSTATLPVAVLQEARRRISPQIHVNYGANETGPLVAAGPELLARHPDCVGRPVAGVELEIVDDEDRPLPAGQAGRIRVRGDEIGPERLPVASAGDAAAFRHGWFYPGDVGTLNAEGIVFFRGRSDDVMNFEGLLVGPAEIEAVLARHPAVAEAAAFALPSVAREQVPAAVVVLRQELPMKDLARHCREQLGARAPRILFQVSAIPKNPMGKVLRRRLVEIMLAQPGVKQRLG